MPIKEEYRRLFKRIRLIKSRLRKKQYFKRSISLAYLGRKLLRDCL